MEFEDQEEEEEGEHEGDIEMGPSYDSLNNNSINSTRPTTTKMPPPPPPLPTSPVALLAISVEPHESSHSIYTKPRYRECLKNHAVGIGSHAVDGCGEFLPAGADGTLDALKCAACNCHRNFHRKETNGGNGPCSDPGFHFFHNTTTTTHHHQPPPLQFSPFYRTPTGYLHVAPHHHQHPPPPPSFSRPLALPSISGGGGFSSREEQEDISNMNSGGGGGCGGIVLSSSSSKKRFRTKFTQEQKDKMLDLAEKLGWRIQKQDEETVKQLCNELGIRRHVLKVWMHNNKNTLGKKP